MSFNLRLIGPRLFVPLMLVACGSRPEAAAAGAGASLSRWVPADVGLCVEARELTVHAGRFLDSELYHRLREFAPLKKWLAASGPDFVRLSQEIERRLGASPQELYHELGSRQLLLAVWPPSKPADEGPVLLLVETSDGAWLAGVVDRLVAAQCKAGTWEELAPLELPGVASPVRVIQPENEAAPLYLVVAGSVGVVASSEELMRDVLELSQNTSDRTSLAALSAYQRGIGRLAPEAAVRAFVNPRPWDAHLLADLRSKPAGSSEASTQLAVVQSWQATEYVVASFELGPQMTLEAFIHWEQSSLPARVGAIVEGIGGPTNFLTRVPDQAIVALAGRIELGRLLKLGPPPPPEGGQEQAPFSPGWLAVVALAGSLGPNVGTWLAPSNEAGQEDAAAALVPWQWVVGIDTQPIDQGASSPALAEVVASLLRSALVAAADNPAYQRETPQVSSVESDGFSLTTVEGLESVPEGIRPSFTAVKGMFLAGTSPAAVREAASLAVTDSLAESERLARQLGPRLASPSHLLFVDAAGLRKLMVSTPGAVEYMARLKGLDEQAARRSWNELLALLRLADTLVAAVRIEEGDLALSVSITAEK